MAEISDLSKYLSDMYCHSCGGKNISSFSEDDDVWLCDDCSATWILTEAIQLPFEVKQNYQPLMTSEINSEAIPWGDTEF